MPASRVLLALVLLLWGSAAWGAADDEQIWFSAETRARVNDRTGAVPAGIRVTAESRISLEEQEIDEAIFRIGAIWDLAPSFYVIGGIAFHLRNTGPQTEYRVELEPNFVERLGPLLVASRTRIELRLGDVSERWRIRSQLRVTWLPGDATVGPFLQEEPFIALWPEVEFTQNRAAVGVAWTITEALRLDGAIMLRSVRQPTDWRLDTVLFIGLQMATWRPR